MPGTACVAGAVGVREAAGRCTDAGCLMMACGYKHGLQAAGCDQRDRRVDRRPPRQPATTKAMVDISVSTLSKHAVRHLDTHPRVVTRSNSGRRSLHPAG